MPSAYGANIEPPPICQFADPCHPLPQELFGKRGITRRDWCQPFYSALMEVHPQRNHTLHFAAGSASSLPFNLPATASSRHLLFRHPSHAGVLPRRDADRTWMMPRTPNPAWPCWPQMIPYLRVGNQRQSGSPLASPSAQIQ
jgi:hypothetical protein